MREKMYWRLAAAMAAAVMAIPAAGAGAEEGRQWREPFSGMVFVRVPGGCYEMGDVFGDGGRETRPAHEVCVDSFYIGKYEVTQGQWRKVMGGDVRRLRDKADKNGKLYGVGDNYPVYYVAWEDAAAFTRALSAKTGMDFRLPTEAEWEYAARSGGGREKFSGGASADAVAWHQGNSGGMAHPVGGKRANGLGIYDMSGNALEWVADWYDNRYYEHSPKLNPQGPSHETDRVHRGGSWRRAAKDATTIYRGCARPDAAGAEAENGFRVVLSAAAVK